ncbi:MAG: ferrochelatase [Candidatus Puniceispirillales bacterium]
MSVKHYPSDHPDLPRHPKTGILLVNLGTPDGTDYKSMRRYLDEFLSDKRVVEAPRLLWWVILNGIILNTRPKKSGAAYDRIWLKDDPDGSPLRKYTRLQAEYIAGKMEKAVAENRLHVSYAMRYGQPSIASRLKEMKDAGCNRLLIVPLYPQYAAATTATVNDEVFKWMLDQRWQPALRTVAPWHDHPQYITALAKSVKASLKGKMKDPEQHLLVSFHGIPQRYFVQGDPYHCQCMKTARLLREHLGWDEARYHVSFQSRFGREPWLQPYTDETIEKLAHEGVKNLAIMAPGFAADCLETLEELNMEGREEFIENGGENFTYIPCLNAEPGGMGLIETLISENIGGWL